VAKMMFLNQHNTEKIKAYGEGDDADEVKEEDDGWILKTDDAV